MEMENYNSLCCSQKRISFFVDHLASTPVDVTYFDYFV